MSWKLEGLRNKERSRLKDMDYDIRDAMGWEPRQFSRAKKDRRWCRGHTGREHDFTFVRRFRWWSGKTTVVRRCSVCGKQDWSKWT